MHLAARRIVLLALLGASLPAFAEPRDDARRLFLAGLEAVERGAYGAALERFLAAQEIYPHPATVYNIAKAYQDLGDDRRALHWYRQFASDVPERTEEVRRTIAFLEARLARQTDAPASQPLPAAPRPAADDPRPDAQQARIAELEAQVKELQLRLALQSGPVVLTPPVAEAPATPSPQPLPPTPLPSAAPEGPPEAPPTADGSFLTDAYERVVITASRYGQDPLDSPSTVTVITAEDIRASGATNVADLLRRVPGVEVMSLASSNPSVGIRGFNAEISTKVLWLVDGRPIAWDFLAAPFPLNLTIALQEIERIEVIRGPGSAVYGANAVTGVINIVTREPGESPGQLLSFSFGAPDFLQATGVSSGRVKDVSWRVSAGYDQDGRWAKDGNVTPGGPVVPFTDDQDLAGRKVRANARLDYRFLDKGFASASAGYSEGFSEFLNIGALGGYALQGRTHNVRGDLSYGPVHLRSFWNHEGVSTGPWTQPVDTPRDLDAQLQSDVFDVEIEGNFVLEREHVFNQFIMGAGYRYKRFQFDYLEGGFDTPWVQHHAEAFFQDQFRYKWFSIVAALRLDVHPLLPVSETLSPRGALIFRVAPNTSVRLGGGTGFRAPNAVESYMDLELPTTADGTYIRDLGFRPVGNTPGLRPERLLTAELGVHDRSSRFHELDATVYWNRVTDLIGLESVTPVLAPYDPQNNGFPAGTTGWVNQSTLTYDAVGGEAEVAVFPVTGLDIFANVAIQRIFEAGPDDTVIDQSSSLVKVNAGVTYRAPFRMTFDVRGHYVSPQAWRLREFDAAGQLQVVTREIPERWLMSARIAGKPFAKRDIELALVLWNPLGFGDRFREHPKGQPVGARLFGNVTFGF